MDKFSNILHVGFWFRISECRFYTSRNVADNLRNNWRHFQKSVDISKIPWHFQKSLDISRNPLTFPEIFWHFQKSLNISRNPLTFPEIPWHFLRSLGNWWNSVIAYAVAETLGISGNAYAIGYLSILFLGRSNLFLFLQFFHSDIFSQNARDLSQIVVALSFYLSSTFLAATREPFL